MSHTEFQILVYGIFTIFGAILGLGELLQGKTLRWNLYGLSLLVIWLYVLFQYNV